MAFNLSSNRFIRIVIRPIIDYYNFEVKVKCFLRIFKLFFEIV